MSENTKPDSNRAEIKALIKSGDAFSVIGDRIEKAYEAADGEFYIEAIGSSDQEDLVGDIMSAKALSQMETDFVGKTVFMNHRTNVPDDVFGSILETKLIKQNGMQLLWFKIIVEKENESAMKSWRMMHRGHTKLCTSVTVLVKAKSANPTRNKGIIIDEVEALELSIVGIGANRESKCLTASASKALAIALREKNLEKGRENMKNEIILMPRSNEAIIAMKAVVETIAKNEKPEIQELVVKGLFNDILNQEPSLWDLFDILSSVRYRLLSQKWSMDAAGVTDFSALIALWDEALAEFSVAAKSSFLYWGEFNSESADALDDDDYMEMSLSLEKSFTDFAEKFQKSAPEAQDKLLGIGKNFLEIAKKINLISEAEANLPATPPLEIETNETYLAMKSRAETAENSIAELETNLATANQELEIAKAGLSTSLEAMRLSLRQPLQIAN